MLCQSLAVLLCMFWGGMGNHRCDMGAAGVLGRHVLQHLGQVIIDSLRQLNKPKPDLT